jgi:hypothetical protein
MRIWIRDDIGISRRFHRSPIVVRKMWKASDDIDPRPSWAMKNESWKIMARESAVRRVAHLARKEFNALMVHVFPLWHD